MNARRKLGMRAGVGAALALVLAGVAWGGIPGNDGAIHGCYGNANGQLRVIDADSGACRNNETALGWSQAGPQGPQGEQGLPGAQGEPGPQGPAGVSGIHRVSKASAPTTGGQDVVFAECPAGEDVLGAPGYAILIRRGSTELLTGNDAVRIDFVIQNNMNREDGSSSSANGSVAFTVDPSLLGPGESAQVIVFVTCAAIG